MNQFRYILCLTSLALLLPGTELAAQQNEKPAGSMPSLGLELTPMFGYMFGGKLRGYDGELNVGDGFTFGVTVAKEIRPGTNIEFSWNGMHTDARLREYFEAAPDETFDMDVNYFLLSTTQYWQTGSDNILPFGLMGIGASSHKLTKSANDRISDGTEWFFSAAFGLGVKVFVNDRIGVRLQGRMLMPMTFGGVNLWCGTGGCGTGVYTSSSILQGDLSGGLIFRF